MLAQTSDLFRVHHDLLEKVMLSLQYHGTYCNYKQPGWKKCSCKLEISVNCHECNVIFPVLVDGGRSRAICFLAL